MLSWSEDTDFIDEKWNISYYTHLKKKKINPSSILTVQVRAEAIWWQSYHKVAQSWITYYLIKEIDDNIEKDFRELSCVDQLCYHSVPYDILYSDPGCTQKLSFYSRLGRIPNLLFKKEVFIRKWSKSLNKFLDDNKANYEKAVLIKEERDRRYEEIRTLHNKIHMKELYAERLSKKMENLNNLFDPKIRSIGTNNSMREEGTMAVHNHGFFDDSSEKQGNITEVQLVIPDTTVSSQYGIDSFMIDNKLEEDNEVGPAASDTLISVEDDDNLSDKSEENHMFQPEIQQEMRIDKDNNFFNDNETQFMEDEEALADISYKQNFIIALLPSHIDGPVGKDYSHQGGSHIEIVTISDDDDVIVISDDDNDDDDDDEYFPDTILKESGSPTV